MLQMCNRSSNRCKARLCSPHLPSQCVVLLFEQFALALETSCCCLCFSAPSFGIFKLHLMPKHNFEHVIAFSFLARKSTGILAPYKILTLETRANLEAGQSFHGCIELSCCLLPLVLFAFYRLQLLAAYSFELRLQLCGSGLGIGNRLAIYISFKAFTTTLVALQTK